MAYNKTLWKDRIVEKPNTYRKVENTDGTITLYPATGQVIEKGTPVSAANLNKLENGIVEVYKELDNKIDGVANKGTTTEVLKKTTEDYIQEKLEDGTIANLTLADGSIDTEKYKDGSITQEKIDPNVKLGNDIEDNLESTRTDAVLSAKQGNILNKKVKNLEAQNSGINNSLIELQEMVASKDYDTIVTLPYAASIGTNVMIEFSSGSSTTLINQISNRLFNNVEGWTSESNYGADVHSIEGVTFDGKKCLKLKYTKDVGYQEVKSINPGGKVWDSTHKYFIYANVYISSRKSSQYPNVGVVAPININNSKTGVWQEGYSKFTVPSYNKQNVIFRIMQDGEMYLHNPILLDLTELKLENKSETELVELIRCANFAGEESSPYSCIIQNGVEQVELEPFTTGRVIKFMYVAQGNTLKITNRSGYLLPSAIAKINTNGAIITDVIQKTRFFGKKVNFEGDSITQSTYLPAYGGKSWANYLSEKLGFGTIRNYAIGGSSISTYNAAGSVVKRIKSDKFDPDCDLVFVFAGTNDWNANVPLGELDSTDESTMLGALNVIIDTLQTKCPEATIVVMTPMHRSGTRTAVRAAGTMMEVAEAYEKVCERWGVDCVNTLRTFGINAYNKTIANKYFCEQNTNELHPNPAGHMRMADRMAGYVSTL